jgi:hypothetical protein
LSIALSIALSFALSIALSMDLSIVDSYSEDANDKKGKGLEIDLHCFQLGFKMFYWGK